VQIHIPAIGVKRAIIELPMTRDPRTGAWKRDVKALFRRRGKDLVGHWGGSAYPGQGGNTILVGHNYGYGTYGVFLRIDRLKPGQEIGLVSEAGQTLTYQVTGVRRIPWRRKDTRELQRHTELLAAAGPERLTLVTCGGGSMAPFPARIYVVAEPAH
jgi:LPXTG-site transpeptidase (sortase) family protein